MTPRSVTEPQRKREEAQNAELERLGMGIRKINLAAAASAPKPKKVATAEDTTMYAREKFGSQKGTIGSVSFLDITDTPIPSLCIAISSDMYFERGSYDPNARAEAQTRLQTFQGATSISSTQYFGRDEDEEAAVLASSSAAGSGYLNEETLQNLGASARDAYQRVLANPDVQNIGESLRTGALKVRGTVLVDGKKPLIDFG